MSGRQYYLKTILEDLDSNNFKSNLDEYLKTNSIRIDEFLFFNIHDTLIEDYIEDNPHMKNCIYLEDKVMSKIYNLYIEELSKEDVYKDIYLDYYKNDKLFVNDLLQNNKKQLELNYKENNKFLIEGIIDLIKKQPIPEGNSYYMDSAISSVKSILEHQTQRNKLDTFKKDVEDLPKRLQDESMNITKSEFKNFDNLFNKIIDTFLISQKSLNQKIDNINNEIINNSFEAPKFNF